MNKIETLCDDCRHSDVCKHKDHLYEITKKLLETAVTFSSNTCEFVKNVVVDCKYYEQQRFSHNYLSYDHYLSHDRKENEK